MLTTSLFIVEPRFRELFDGPARLLALAVIAAPVLVCYRFLPTPERSPARQQITMIYAERTDARLAR